jgi:type IV pilus assembly protein PilM
MLGNASKLPGLRQFLEQQLELKIDRFESFEKLSGAEVVGQKTFAENMRAFAPCYGLSVQALGKSVMTTNLLPEEFVVEKIVRAKKPWVLSAVALVMVGLAVQHAMGSWYGFVTSDDFRDSGNKAWKEVKQRASAVSSRSGQFKSEDDQLKTELGHVNNLGQELVSASTARTQILRVLSAISQVIPKDPRSQDLQVDPATLSFIDREEIFLDGFTQTYVEDLATWFTEGVKAEHESELKDLRRALGMEVAAEDAAATASDSGGADPTTPTGAGWTIEINGHHYVNSEDRAQQGLATGRAFLRESLLYNMLNQEVVIAGETFLLQDLGIVKPTIIRASAPTATTVPGTPAEQAAQENAPVEDEEMSDDERMRAMQKMYGAGSRKSGMAGAAGGSGEAAEIENGVPATRTSFTIMAAWMPQTPEQALARRAARLERERLAAEQAQAAENSESQDETM